MLKRLASYFLPRAPKVAPVSKPYPVHLPACGSPIRGNALFSYIADSVGWPDGHLELLAHSNFWESREIARILTDLGFAVDAVNWNDEAFQPAKEYDLVLDIDANLQRWAPLLPEKTVRILHLTGSYGPFQNKAELERVAAFEQRTGKLYSPKRLVRWLELAERSLRLAHHCSLIGNEATLNTYPEEYREKITLIPVSGSALSRTRTAEEIASGKREFLWFFESGAVHKGLDLVLEAFGQHPEWVLHVVGSAPCERDFMAAYGRYLSLPNIRVHGHLKPGQASFAEEMRDVFCFIAPTCSEGTSPAVVTCLQWGLFPIRSRQTGVDVPDGCGVFLDDLTPLAVEQAVQTALEMNNCEIVRQTRACQELALEKYSRKAFSQAYSVFLRNIVGG